MAVVRQLTREQEAELDLLSKAMDGIARQTLPILARAQAVAFAFSPQEGGLTATTAEAARVVVPIYVQTMASALHLLSNGDHGSAGALARKALECVYALATVAKRGDEGVRLLQVAATRQHARGFEMLIPNMDQLGFAVSKERVIDRVRQMKSAVPNQDTSRVEMEKLAAWAGLEEMHKTTYELLNSYAHFDVVHALEQASLGRQMLPAIVRRRTVVIQECLRMAVEAMKALCMLGMQEACGAAESCRKYLDESEARLFPLYARFGLLCGRQTGLTDA
jgi:hypothetical protein